MRTAAMIPPAMTPTKHPTGPPSEQPMTRPVTIHTSAMPSASLPLTTCAWKNGACSNAARTAEGSPPAFATCAACESADQMLGSIPAMVAAIEGPSTEATTSRNPWGDCPAGASTPPARSFESWACPPAYGRLNPPGRLTESEVINGFATGCVERPFNPTAAKVEPRKSPTASRANTAPHLRFIEFRCDTLPHLDSFRTFCVPPHA